MAPESKEDTQFIQWLGAEVPSEYATSLDDLIVQSFGGCHLEDLPPPDRRCVIIDDTSVLAHAGIQSRIFTLHETIYHGFVLGAVCSHPAFRLQGFGTQIVEYLLSQLPKEEGDFVALNCGETVTNFYEKMGFCIISPRAGYIRNGVHEIDDDPVMAISLKNDFSVQALEADVFPMIDEF